MLNADTRKNNHTFTGSLAVSLRLICWNWKHDFWQGTSRCSDRFPSEATLRTWAKSNWTRRTPCFPGVGALHEELLFIPHVQLSMNPSCCRNSIFKLQAAMQLQDSISLMCSVCFSCEKQHTSRLEVETLHFRHWGCDDLLGNSSSQVTARRSQSGVAGMHPCLSVPCLRGNLWDSPYLCPTPWALIWMLAITLRLCPQHVWSTTGGCASGSAPPFLCSSWHGIRHSNPSRTDWWTGDYWIICCKLQSTVLQASETLSMRCPCCACDCCAGQPNRWL